MNFFLLILCLLQFNSTLSQKLFDKAILNEKYLRDDIFKSYNKLVRPTQLVKSNLTFRLRMIKDIDEKKKTLYTSIFVSQTWHEPRLRWNPSLYNNISYIRVPIKNIWYPDLFISNANDGNGFIQIDEKYLATISSKGWTYILLSQKSLVTRCQVNVRKFPFDEQTCNVFIGSWALSINEFVFDNNPNPIDKEGYVDNELWTIKSIKLNKSLFKKQTATYDIIESNDSNDYSTEYISYELVLKRKPLFFMVNSIFPMLVLNLINLATHFLPFSFQIGLCNLYLNFKRTININLCFNFV